MQVNATGCHHKDAAVDNSISQIPAAVNATASYLLSCYLISHYIKHLYLITTLINR